MRNEEVLSGQCVPHNPVTVETSGPCLPPKERRFEETRKYEISGARIVLDGLERIFRYMVLLGNIGSSRHIHIFCDGDGAARIEVKRPDGAPLKTWDDKTYFDYDRNMHITLPDYHGE